MLLTDLGDKTHALHTSKWVNIDNFQCHLEDKQLFLKGFGGDYSRSYPRATAVAREAIVNIRIVAAFGAEERMSIQFASEMKEPNKQALLRGHISVFGYGVTQLFAFCSYALGLWYASVLMKDKNSNFGDLIKCFMILIITALVVAETLALAPDIVKGSQALGSVFDILHRKPAIIADRPTSTPITSIKGDIEFRNVSFKYPARPDIMIFDGLNLEVSSGKSMAIVGQSGSGKTTVSQLLMRFYDPTSEQWTGYLELYFQKEVADLARIDHENTSKLLGYSRESSPFTRMLVFEYASNGTLIQKLII